MSGIISEGGVPAQFQSQLFVGSGTGIPFSGVQNTFTTLQAAIDFINAQTGAAAPSLTNKYVIDVYDALLPIVDVILPDWVWVRGRGIDNTAFVESAASGDYLISTGVGGLIDLSMVVGQAAGNAFPQYIQVRDSASLYSPNKEAFAITGGETLNFQVGGTTLVTVTLGVGDTTAALIAAAIIAQGGGSLTAFDSDGRVRVRGVVGGAGDVLLELFSTGTANGVLGWSTTVTTQTLDPATDVEARVIDRVLMSIIGSTQNGRYGVNIDDVGGFVSKIRHFQFASSSLDGSGANGIRFGGSGLSLENVEFNTKGIGFDFYDDGLNPGTLFFVDAFNCVWKDTVGPQQIMLNDEKLELRAAACSYNPTKVFKGAPNQPVNVTGVTLDEFSEDTPSGSGTLTFVATGTLLSWAASGDAAGDTVNVGAGGSFTLSSDDGSLVNVTVVGGSLPGTDQSDSIAVIASDVVALTQAGSIKFNDPKGFLGPANTGKDVEDGLIQVMTEVRSVSIRASDASVAGIPNPQAALDGLIGDFPTKVYSDTTDKKAVWLIKLPNVAAFGNRKAVLEIDSVIGSASTPPNDQVKFDVLARYLDDGDDLTGANDETLTTTFTVGTQNLRADITIDLNEALLAGNQWLRFEIARDTTVANNVPFDVHIMGITVRL